MDGLFNLTTLTIAVPASIQAFFLLLIARQKGFFLLVHSDWQRRLELPDNATKSALATIASVEPRLPFILTKFAIYAASILLFNLVAFAFIPIHFPQARSVWQVFYEIAWLDLKLVLALAPAAFVFTFCQGMHEKRSAVLPVVKPRTVCRFFISHTLFCWLCSLTVAPMQYILGGITGGAVDFTAVRYFFYVQLAFSSFFMAVLGMMMCYFNSNGLLMREQKLLSAQPLSEDSLRVADADKLHQVTEAALKLGNFEAAEIVSQHLLRRAEAPLSVEKTSS